MKTLKHKKNNMGETDTKFNMKAISNDFAKLCWDCTSSNQVRIRMKKLMSLAIIWQGNRIKWTKTAMTNLCNFLVEKLEIMHRYSTNRAKLINNNSDIFATCTCFEKNHTFKTVGHTDTDDRSCS